jgi:hypothetical protein
LEETFNFQRQRRDLARGRSVGIELSREPTGRYAIGKDYPLVDLGVQRWDAVIRKRSTCFATDDRTCDAAIYHESCAQYRPEDARLTNKRDHLHACPNVVGTGLDWDEDHIRGKKRRTGERGHSRWPVDDDVIDGAGDFGGFEVQGLSCQTHHAKEPRIRSFLAPLRPIQGGALRVRVDEYNRRASTGILAGEVRGEGGLAGPAFLV